MHKIAMFCLSLSMILTSCDLALGPPGSAPGGTAPISQTSASIPEASRPAQTMPRSQSSPPAEPGSVPATAPANTEPTAGVLSDPALIAPGNPRTHAELPVPRNLEELVDKTRSENEAYRPVFADHLRRTYPEYSFAIVDIMEYQQDGKTFRQAQAFAHESLDVNLFLYFDGHQVFDSFQRDVIGRRTTMNRWRAEFRSLLDPLSSRLIPVSEASFDVSYDYYDENSLSIRLDQPLDPASTAYPRALELYIERPSADLLVLSTAIHDLFAAVAETGYSFSDYYVHIRQSNGQFISFEIPLRLIGNPLLITEMEQSLRSPGADRLIRPVPKPRP